MCFCTPSIRTSFCHNCSTAMFKRIMELSTERDEQAAQIEIYRSTLAIYAKLHFEEAIEALSITPSQALEAFAAKVREQCVEKIAMQKYSAPRYAEERNWNAGVGAALIAIKGIKEIP